jgi:hypothetical protein
VAVVVIKGMHIFWVYRWVHKGEAFCSVDKVGQQPHAHPTAACQMPHRLIQFLEVTVVSGGVLGCQFWGDTAIKGCPASEDEAVYV